MSDQAMYTIVATREQAAKRRVYAALSRIIREDKRESFDKADLLAIIALMAKADGVSQ